MTLISVAIVGKTNEPLFLKEFRDEESPDDLPEAELFGLSTSTTTADEGNSGGTEGFTRSAMDISLRQQFILHAALDRFEELEGPPPGFGWRAENSTGRDAMWVGLLNPVEEMRVFGYMTCTRLKILAVVEDSMPERVIQSKVIESEVKQLVIKIHELFVEYTLNPFNTIPCESKIESPRFDRLVSEVVGKFNRTF